jgi:SAM-dependent methyltransferase
VRSAIRTQAGRVRRRLPVRWGSLRRTRPVSTYYGYDRGNPIDREATIVADLASAGSLPENRFDCLIVTQTLQYVSRPVTAIENLRQSLAPVGVALVTVPCLGRIDPDLAAVDRWRFTPAGLELLFQQAGGWPELEVRGFGNVLTSAAFLYGLPARELRTRELAEHDASFPLTAAARARAAEPAA